MRRYSIIYKSVLVLSALIGLILQFASSTNIIETFSYYTIQSNLWVLFFFGYLLYREVYKLPKIGKWLLLFKGMFTVGIFVTFLVYHFIIRPSLEGINTSFEVGGINDFFIHYFVPLLTLFDWVFFDVKGKLLWYFPLVWLVQPLDYLVYVGIYNLLGGRFNTLTDPTPYPYFFLNVERFGILGVMQWSVLIVLLYIVLGYLLYFIDGAILYFQIKANEKRG
jgi:hypothetical protein